MDWKAFLLHDGASAAFFLNLAVQSLVILGAAWLWVKFLGPRSAPARRGLLLGGLLSALLLPGAGLALKGIGVSWGPAIISMESERPAETERRGDHALPPSAAPFGETVPLPDRFGLLRKGSAEAVGAEFPGGKNGAATTEAVLSSGAGLSSGTNPDGASSKNIPPWLVPAANAFRWLWTLGAALLLLRIAWGWFRLTRLKNRFLPVNNEVIDRIMTSAKGVFGLRRRPKVYATALTGSPLSLGVLKPCVLLPLDLKETLTEEEVQAVVHHEMAHFRHGDHLIGFLQRLVGALYWWNPFAYLVNACLNEAMEDLCDNHAAGLARNPVHYAECLVNVVSKRFSPIRLPGALGIRHRQGALEKRIRSLMSKERNMNTSLSRKALVSIVLIFALCTALIGGCETSNAPEEKPKATATEAEESMAEEALVGPGKSEIRKGAGRPLQRSEDAVDLGLAWLSRHQDPEGFWDCDGYELNCNDSPCSGHGHALNDVGVTGLSLLAFLGAGNTLAAGPYRGKVKAGVKYLMDVQDASDGCLTPKTFTHYMYNHGIATLALVEAYGLSDWAPLKEPAEKALAFIHHSKNPGKGWRYNLPDRDPLDATTKTGVPQEVNDVSVTTWMLLCLASARDFGLSIDEQDITEGLSFIEEMTDPETGRTGYKSRGSFSSREMGDEMIWPFDAVEAMTAAGMCCRIFCGKNPAEDKMLGKGAALLMKKLPFEKKEKTIDYHYLYYGTYAMFQLAGKDWDTWRKNAMAYLASHQHTEGCTKGSWDPQPDPWGDSGGRIYSTAICTLCMEVFYRYDRLLKDR